MYLISKWQDAERGVIQNGRRLFPKVVTQVGVYILHVQDIHEIVPETKIIQVVDFMQP